MKEFVPVLKETKLFAGVEEEDVFSMLSCLGARLRTYKKGEYVLRQGQRLSDILVLAEGSLYTVNDFVFTGEATASLTDAGTTQMGLAAKMTRNGAS